MKDDRAPGPTVPPATAVPHPAQAQGLGPPKIDLTISGHLSLSPSGSLGACLWCGKPSTSAAMAPGLGWEVPIHVLCCGRVIRAARRWLETGEEPSGWAAYAGRMRILASGEK